MEFFNIGDVVRNKSNGVSYIDTVNSVRFDKNSVFYHLKTSNIYTNANNLERVYNSVYEGVVNG